MKRFAVYISGEHRPEYGEEHGEKLVHADFFLDGREIEAEALTAREVCGDLPADFSDCWEHVLARQKERGLHRPSRELGEEIGIRRVRPGGHERPPYVAVAERV